MKRHNFQFHKKINEGTATIIPNLNKKLVHLRYHELYEKQIPEKPGPVKIAGNISNFLEHNLNALTSMLNFFILFRFISIHL